MADKILTFSADVSPLKQGVEEAKVSIVSLGETASKTGKTGADGLSKITVSAKEVSSQTDAAAKKMERSAQSIANSIQRDIAAVTAGNKATSDYYKIISQQRGIDVTQFEPLLKQLDAANARIKQSTISVGQYNNAMRMVPMQLTDVVTQLAGGQSPFLIAIQQGGQMRDSFGGIGTMFKGLMSLITPARVIFGGLAAGIGAVGVAMYQGAQDTEDYRNAIILAGAKANVTANDLQMMSEKVGQSTGNYSAAKEAMIGLAKSGAVSAGDYERVANSIVLASEYVGKSVQEMVDEYKKIADDPVKAMLSLQDTYTTLTPEVYAQARALVEQGDKQEAVTLIQRKYADETASMSEQVRENLGWIERSWKGVESAAASAWDSMKSIGRDASVEVQIAKLKSELATSLQVDGGYIFAESKQAKLKEEIARLEAQKEQADRDNRERAEKLKSSKLATEGMSYFDKEAEKNLSKKEQMQRELNKSTEYYNNISKNITDEATKQSYHAKYQADQAGIREKYAEKEHKTRKKISELDKATGSLKFKSSETTAGGKAEAGTYEFASVMQKVLGDDLKWFAAFNDRKHKAGRHKQGLAFDMSLVDSGKSEAVVKRMREMLLDTGFTEKDFGILDEYKTPSKNATGGHIHFNWRSPQAAQKFAENSGNVKKFATQGVYGVDKKTDAEKVVDESKAYVRSLDEQLAMLGKNNEYEKALWITTDGKFRGISAEQKKALTDAATSIDLKKKEIDQQERYKSVLEEITQGSAIKSHLEELAMIEKMWKNGEISAEQYKLKKDELDKSAPKALGQSTSAFQTWIDDAQKITFDLDKAGANMLDGMTDSLTNFVTTGKLSFGDFANSVVKDLARIAAQKAIAGIFSSLFGAASSGFSGGSYSLPQSSLDLLSVPGYSDGGFTGFGGKHDPAGVVHRGEVVFSQDDVKRFGGVSRVEAMRLRGYANGGVVGGGVAMTSGSGVTVGDINVTVESGKTGMDADKGKQLGHMVRASVLEVIMEQKRQGGCLA